MGLNVINLPEVSKETINEKIQDLSKTLNMVRTHHYSPLRGIGTIVSFLLFLASLGLLNASLTSSIFAETVIFLLLLSFVFIPSILVYYLWKVDEYLSKYPEFFGLSPDSEKDPVYSQYRRDLLGHNLLAFVLALIVFLFVLFVLLVVFSKIHFPSEIETAKEYLRDDSVYNGFISLMSWSFVFLVMLLVFYLSSKMNDIALTRLNMIKIRQPWKLYGTRFFYLLFMFLVSFVVGVWIIWHFYGSVLVKTLDSAKDILLNLIQIPAFYLSMLTLLWIFGEILSQLSKILVESHLLTVYLKLNYIADLLNSKKATTNNELMIFYYEHVEKYSKVSAINLFVFFPVWIYVPSMRYVEYSRKMSRMPGIITILRDKLQGTCEIIRSWLVSILKRANLK